MKIIKNRGEQIESLKKRSAKRKSKTNLILLIFCICFFGWAIYFVQSHLIDFYSIIGEKASSPIVAISKGIVTLFILAFALGIALGYLIYIISNKYNKDDLLIDSCERIEKLEKKIEELKKT